MKKRKRKQRKTPRAPILNANAMRPFNLAGQPVELIAAASEGDDVRRFKMVAYTGVAMRVMGFRNPVVVDLSGLAIRAQRTAILKDHSPSLIIGHTTNVQVRAPELFAEGVVTAAASSPRSLCARRSSASPGRPASASCPRASRKCGPVSA